MDVDEAIRVLEARAGSPTFRRAVGSAVDEAVRTIIDVHRCSVCIDLDRAIELLQNLHLFRMRMRRLLEALDELLKGNLAKLLEEIDIEVDHVPEGGAQGVGDVHKALLGEVESFESYLGGLVEMVRGARARCRERAGGKAT